MSNSYVTLATNQNNISGQKKFTGNVTFENEVKLENDWDMDESAKIRIDRLEWLPAAEKKKD